MNADFQITPEEVDCACQRELPELVWQGFALFDRREFFEAHELLETAWRAEAAPVRELYRGILQIAVAYLHIERGNYRGALKMFQRSQTWLSPFPNVCCGINLAQFRQDYHHVEETLRRLGPDRVSLFDPGIFKPIPLITAETK